MDDSNAPSVDEASALSFPASDPPSFTPLHAGAPAPPEPLAPAAHGLAAVLRDIVREIAPLREERAPNAKTSERMVEGIVRYLRALETGALVRRPLHDGFRTFESIELELAGSTRREEIVIIGAHYDASEAHDNVSGIAGALELARRAAMTGPGERTLRFVFFPNGELRRINREHLGSKAYAELARARQEKIVAMLALECLGCRAGSKERDAFTFPTPGLVFVSNLPSRKLTRGAARVFREASSVRVDTAMLPGMVPLLRSMDHWAFWKAGFHAFAVTDTWPLRDGRFCAPVHDAHHEVQLDFHRMAKSTVGLDAVLSALRRG